MPVFVAAVKGEVNDFFFGFCIHRQCAPAHFLIMLLESDRLCRGVLPKPVADALRRKIAPVVGIADRKSDLLERFSAVEGFRIGWFFKINGKRNLPKQDFA